MILGTKSNGFVLNKSSNRFIAVIHEDMVLFFLEDCSGGGGYVIDYLYRLMYDGCFLYLFSLGLFHYNLQEN